MEKAEARGWRRWWPHLRAAFVLFHVLGVFLLSIPATGAMRNRSAWRQPHARRELQVWGERAHALGFDVTQAEFEQWLWEVAGDYLRVRGRGVAPFDTYARYTGALQGWPMFSTPQSEPAWLTIEVGDGAGEFTTVYRERSAEHEWMRRQLDHNRVRKLEGRLGRGRYGGAYVGLVDWLARRAAVDFPEASVLRAHIERRRTPDPSGESEIGYGPPRRERQRVVDLEALR